MKRFSAYLNQSFYLNADLFLKNKHRQFLKTQKQGKKVETVFTRMEKDNKARKEADKKKELEAQQKDKL